MCTYPICFKCLYTGCRVKCFDEDICVGGDVWGCEFIISPAPSPAVAVLDVPRSQAAHRWEGAGSWEWPFTQPNKQGLCPLHCSAQACSVSCNTPVPVDLHAIIYTGAGQYMLPFNQVGSQPLPFPDEGSCMLYTKTLEEHLSIFG